MMSPFLIVAAVAASDALRTSISSVASQDDGLGSGLWHIYPLYDTLPLNLTAALAVCGIFLFNFHK
jgi:hypothetical protein